MKTRFALSVLSLALLAACSGTNENLAPVTTAVDRPTSGSTATPVQPGTIATTPATEGGANQGDPGGMTGLLGQRSIYFAFDDYTVDAKYQPMLQAHANNIKARRNLKLLIQGHADERGSREYNLALGQKRADAVKRSLALLGVTEDMIQSVSLGEEKPKNAGRDETAWAENRRADIVYEQ